MEKQPAKKQTGQYQKSVSDKGATMRLGAYPCRIREGSLAQRIYGALEISEFYYVTGQYSLVVKAYVSSTEHLAKLLEKTQIFGVTETFVVMYSNIKKELF